MKDLAINTFNPKIWLIVHWCSSQDDLKCYVCLMFDHAMDPLFIANYRLLAGYGLQFNILVTSFLSLPSYSVNNRDMEGSYTKADSPARHVHTKPGHVPTNPRYVFTKQREASKNSRHVSTKSRYGSTDPRYISTNPRYISTKSRNVSTKSKDVSTKPKYISPKPNSIPMKEAAPCSRANCDPLYDELYGLPFYCYLGRKHCYRKY